MKTLLATALLTASLAACSGKALTPQAVESGVYPAPKVSAAEHSALEDCAFLAKTAGVRSQHFDVVVNRTECRQLMDKYGSVSDYLTGIYTQSFGG